MDNERLDDITNSIKTKLGDDNVAIISDDLGMLITENNKSINIINDLNAKNKELEEKNKMLVNANSRLLTQVPMEKEDTKDKEENEESSKPKTFSLMDLFDEKGHFKKR